MLTSEPAAIAAPGLHALWLAAGLYASASQAQGSARIRIGSRDGHLCHRSTARSN